MAWNWQQPDWPRFQWDRARIEAAERLFLVSGGVFVGTLRHLGSEERDQFNNEAMGLRTECARIIGLHYMELAKSRFPK
jgi:Fic family protein